MRFNKPVDLIDSHDLSFAGKLVVNGDDKSSLIAVDTLKIDSHFRITVTKKVRDILPVKPGDSIAVYRDISNSDIILKLQRGSKVVDTLRITQKRTDVDDNIIALQHFGLGRNIKSNINQRDSTNLLDKVKELAGSRYHLDDPLKRYFPNIILIDDDPDILLTFQSFLSAEGFNVQTFSESYEALKFLTSRPTQHSVVITDIRMANLNGIQLYQMLKSVHKNMKVIFLSALDSADEILSMFPEIKRSDIIRKPVEKDEFVNRVKSAIFSSLTVIFIDILNSSTSLFGAAASL